ncbi:MAG: hypothetical protein ABI743_13965, partial [bacterium]
VTGMLYLAFGVGTLIGPAVMRWMGEADVAVMFRRLWLGFAITGVFEIVFAITGPFSLAWVYLTLSCMGRAILWIYSTLLLQIILPDRFRGRAFAVEFGLMQLSMIGATILGKVAVDAHWLDVRGLGVALGVIATLGTFPYLRFLLPNSAPVFERNDT